ncbi:MAG: flavodoxin family protein, partial [bacterium]
VEWLATRAKIQAAAARQADASAPSRVLVICASGRNDGTCPGEISKTHRMVGLATEAIADEDPAIEIDVLDLSWLASQPLLKIHPCKACVSTAMPLCHWPCSCYPNHALNQVNDWMGEIYERWVAAHAVVIVTPTHWYSTSSGLKLMIDRLVCADGGNPDPTTTRGKNPGRAKALELAGWPYPRHLAGRAFAVIVHGDAEGAETLRRNLHDWLVAMKLEPAGAAGSFDRYIGYYRPYATSHEDLDGDPDLFVEVRNAMRTLHERIAQLRAGVQPPGRHLESPRQK